MTSVWSQTARLPEYAPLDKDIKVDALVVGGGMAGLCCARALRRAGAACALIEAGRLCGGVTKGTTAKITSQHGLIYHKLTNELGTARAKQYLDANETALAAFRALAQEIDCDFEEKDAFCYSIDDRAALEREAAAARALGINAEVVEAPALPFETAGAVRFPGQAQFHPLKFAAAIADGLPIYEHTKLLKLLPGRAVTTGGVITAQSILIATHFPLLNRRGMYFMKMVQERSYVLALENAPDVGGMYIGADSHGLSFRNWNGLLLFGGAGHRTGEPGGGWKELEELAGRYYPSARVTARWAAQDCMTLDGVPYIGPYSPHTPGLFVATGFGKWGMTGSMAAAMILSDLALGRQNPYAAAFDPARGMKLRPLLRNVLSAAKNLLTPTAPRCPHLGCALVWNAAEHSWDCPCHGSRFDDKGAPLEGPAQKPLSLSRK